MPGPRNPDVAGGESRQIRRPGQIEEDARRANAELDRNQQRQRE
jgi:hypothetical protein